MDDLNILSEENQHLDTNHFNVFLSTLQHSKNWNQGSTQSEKQFQPYLETVFIMLSA